MRTRKPYTSVVNEQKRKDQSEIKRLYSEEKLTLEEIGARVNLTRERVRQIIAARWPELIVQRKAEKAELRVEKEIAREDAKLLTGVAERQEKRARRRKLVEQALKAGKSMTQLARETGEAESKLAGIAQNMRKTGKARGYLRFRDSHDELPIWAKKTKLLLEGRGKNWTRTEQAKELGISYMALSVRIKKLRDLGLIDKAKKRTPAQSWIQPTLDVLLNEGKLSRPEQAKKLGITYNTLSTRVKKLVDRGLATPQQIMKTIHRARR